MSITVNIHLLYFIIQFKQIASLYRLLESYIYNASHYNFIRYKLSQEENMRLLKHNGQEKDEQSNTSTKKTSTWTNVAKRRSI